MTSEGNIIMTDCILDARTAVVDNSRSPEVRFASEALARDLLQRFGVPLGQGQARSIVLELAPAMGGFDRHRIAVLSERIVITGSDELGLIHGIYAFSRQALAIDPFQFFTGIVPPMVDSLAIPVGERESAPYPYRHRGWFINDEDLIIGFQRERQTLGHNLSLWQALFECALRMQCTCIIPGTHMFSDEPQIRLASDMGLHVAQHHVEPLGSNPVYWPADQAYSWTTNRQAFLDFWSKAIRRQVARRVIWSISFRGKGDAPFWASDPNLSPDDPPERKAQIINEVLDAQYRLLREVRGEDRPEMMCYLWGELGDFYSQGLIKVPPGATLMFADNGFSYFDPPIRRVAEAAPGPKGVYQHAQYHCGRGSLRVNTVDPDLINREMTWAHDQGLTDAFILNVGNVREKIYPIHQFMNFATDHQLAASLLEQHAYARWYQREVIRSGCDQVCHAYRNLTGTGFGFDRGAAENGRKRFGDQAYTWFVMRVLEKIHARETDGKMEYFGSWYNGDFSDLAEIIDWYHARFAGSRPAWKAGLLQAERALQEMDGPGRDFFRRDALAQIRQMYFLNEMAFAFTTSVKLYFERAFKRAILASHDAVENLTRYLEEMQAAEGPLLAGWNRHDNNINAGRVLEFLRHWHAILDDVRYFKLDQWRERSRHQHRSLYKHDPSFESAYRDELHINCEK